MCVRCVCDILRFPFNIMFLNYICVNFKEFIVFIMDLKKSMQEMLKVTLNSEIISDYLFCREAKMSTW